VSGEWQPLLSFFRLGYPEDFDREETYQYRRGVDGEPFEMRLADQADWYNIAGLWFRPIPPSLPQAPKP